MVQATGNMGKKLQAHFELCSAQDIIKECFFGGRGGVKQAYLGI